MSREVPLTGSSMKEEASYTQGQFLPGPLPSSSGVLGTSDSLALRAPSEATPV